MTARNKIRHQYDTDSEQAAGEAAISYNNEPSLTQQQFKDDVNINVMMARMGVQDGSIPPGAFDPALFGSVQDFTDAPDLQEIFARTQAAKELFNELPASLRARFGHNPALLMDYVHNPANHEEAVKLGLLVKSPGIPITTPAEGSPASPVIP